ncbi:MAG: metabolite traffic protein EboE [Janthinobacterium lividum]
MWIKPGALDLTYCTNIHAGESWDEVESSVAEFAPALKQRLSPQTPFGLGLRLSALAASQLLAEDRLDRFRSFLDKNGLYVALINGFPFGSFHGTAVKTAVFAPDFRDPARVRYTLNLVEILSRLLPEGMDGGISTIPLSYKPWIPNPDAAWPAIVENLVDVTAELITVRERTGRFIHLDIEPEPNGLVESTIEFVQFFEGPLQHLGAPLLATRLGISLEKARSHLREHIQVCFDTCHMAIQFEDATCSLDLLKKHGIRIGRIQISSALRILFDGSVTQREEIRTHLAPFDNGIYLHQVIEQDTQGNIRRFVDLDQALAAEATGTATEWRIHFHVPLFTEEYGLALSTQAQNRSLLELVMQADITSHLEIETYTWTVLPTALKADLLSSIEREFRWVMGGLCVKP